MAPSKPVGPLREAKARHVGQQFWYVFLFWKWLCGFVFSNAVKGKPLPHLEPSTKIFWIAKPAEHVSHAILISDICENFMLL